jgi:hypothetical protein
MVPISISDYFDWIEDFRARHSASAFDVLNNRVESNAAARAEAWGMFLANTRSGHRGILRVT